MAVDRFSRWCWPLVLAKWKCKTLHSPASQVCTPTIGAKVYKPSTCCSWPCQQDAGLWSSPAHYRLALHLASVLCLVSFSSADLAFCGLVLSISYSSSSLWFHYDLTIVWSSSVSIVVTVHCLLNPKALEVMFYFDNIGREQHCHYLLCLRLLNVWAICSCWCIETWIFGSASWYQRRTSLWTAIWIRLWAAFIDWGTHQGPHLYGITFIQSTATCDDIDPHAHSSFSMSTDTIMPHQNGLLHTYMSVFSYVCSPCFLNQASLRCHPLWIQETHYKVNNPFASNLPYLQSLDPDTSRLETYSFCTFSN